MEITLEKATESDAAVLFQMQIDSFNPLLHRGCCKTHKYPKMNA